MTRQTSANLSVEFVREVGRLEGLDRPWRALAVERENAFATPEWFRCWQRHYGGEQEPLVAAVRSPDGELEGLLPLTASRSGRSPLVRFAGSSVGDHFEPLARPGRELEVGRAVGEAMRLELGARPSLLLENVDAEAGWWRELSQACGCGRNPMVARRATLPRVTFGGRGWEEYLAGRSRNLRSQVGRKRRALERECEARFRWTSEEGEVRDDVETVFSLHDKRWEAQAGDSSLTSPRARAFLADLSRAAFERGWLRLCVLEADGEPVAGWLGWRLGGRFAYYQAGFDPAWADRSVGFVLFAETIRRAAEEGASEYDMLLGTEPFKGRFADSSREVVTAVIAPRLRPVRMLAAGEARLRGIARRLPEGVRAPAKSRGRAVLDRLPLARRH